MDNAVVLELISTESAYLDMIPICPGRLIAVSDTSNLYWDAEDGQRRCIGANVTVCGKIPDQEGNIELTADDINAIAALEKGQALGVAETDSNNKVLSKHLPTNLLIYGDEAVGEVVPTDADTLGGKTLEDIQASISGKLADLPIKKLVGTEANPVNLDDLLEPGIYYISGTQTTTLADHGLLENGYVQSPLMVAVSGEARLQTRLSSTGLGFRGRIMVGGNTVKVPASDYVATSSGAMTKDLAMGGHKITGLGAPVDATDAATMGYVDDKVAEAGDMHASVYDPQGRGEDVFAAIDAAVESNGVPIVIATPLAGGTSGVDYVTDSVIGQGALIRLKLTRDSASIRPKLTCKNHNGTESTLVLMRHYSGSVGFPGGPESVWIKAQIPVLVLRIGNNGLVVSAGTKPLASDIYGIVPPEHGGLGVGSATAGSYLVGNGAEPVQTKTPAEVLVDIGAAAAVHVHTADEVGALPADVSDITDISAISGPEDHVMVKLAGELSVSIDGADKVVVLPDKAIVYQPLHMSNYQITGVKAPTDATDVANKQYVDGQVATRAPVDHSHRPDVAFSCADAVSGNFAPVADSYVGGVYIYCKTKPTATVTIPSIVCIKGV